MFKYYIDKNINKYVKNDKGFTLLEVIISIATLAIISGFVLQMFIVSANANDIAKNKDNGREISKMMIEGFKTHKSLDEVIEVFMLTKENDGTLSTSFFFDSSWYRQVQVDIPKSGDISTLGDAARVDTAFIMFLEVIPKEISNELDSESKIGDYVDIIVTVYCRNDEGVFDLAEEFLEFSTTKYFPYSGQL